jgi:hypothetical protein
MPNSSVGFCASKAAIEKRAEALMKRVKDGTSNISVEGDAAYKAKAHASLEKLAKTPTGLALLEGIERTGKPVKIEAPAAGKGNTETATNWNDGLYDRANGKPGKGTGSTVKFNPDRKQIGDGSEAWHKRDPAVGLGHELIHSYHDANGTTDGRDPVPYKDANGNNNSAPGYEQQTVGLGEYKDSPLTENNIRKDLDTNGTSVHGQEAQRPYY